MCRGKKREEGKDVAQPFRCHEKREVINSHLTVQVSREEVGYVTVQVSREKGGLSGGEQDGNQPLMLGKIDGYGTLRGDSK
jgi:hypothetical protein